MRRIVPIAVADITPEPEAVLRSLRMPEAAAANPRVERLLSSGIETLATKGRPAGVFLEIERTQFGDIYRGNGRNEPDTPLQTIYPEADNLALFAVTLGAEISREINNLFNVRDFAAGAVLDAVASQAAELAGDVVEREYAAVLAKRAGTHSGLPPTPDKSAEPDRGTTCLMRYSPGYCGWHLSGQRALFDALRPAEIGISLRESFLMEPLKSMSGIILAGPAAIHDFEDVYPFCSGCEDHTCRSRIHRILATSKPNG